MRWYRGRASKKTIQNSMINVSVFCNNLCVGVGRIAEDNALKGMLTDIMVLKENQDGVYIWIGK